jgi:hypothetical protein
MSKLLALIPSFLMSVSACSSDSGSKTDYSHCTGADKLVLVDPNDDQAFASSLELPKGVETDIRLEARDADGHQCDPSKIDLSFDDASQIDIVSKGEQTILKHRFDWFDRGAEPTTTMRASLGGLTAAWPTAGVVALDGEWTVTVFETKIYPDGFVFGKVTFAQHGRQLSWEDCTISQACDKYITIQDDQVSSMLASKNFLLEGSISSDRDSFGGNWSTDSYAGSWIATRL